MACAICKLPLDDHESALRVLGELPFDTVKSVLLHQWRKDVTRIIYAHAEHYHDQTLFDDVSPCHKRQLHSVEADLKRHRAKYVMHYLHAVVEVYRHDEVGATRVTMADEMVVRRKLYVRPPPPSPQTPPFTSASTWRPWRSRGAKRSRIRIFSCMALNDRLDREEALDYQLPVDLDVVFRQAKPFAWQGMMTWEQVKRCRDDVETSVEMANQMLERGYVQEAIDRRLLMVISMAVHLRNDETGDGLVMFVPKTPDPMWCWNQTTKHIQTFQHMTKLDLF
ncbi:hypothetical protein F5Y14DRAFT_320311 [Nemania sp. NC0429]|nr:hypothetical protein F5Y14DRAFT_320311 [Nemania sp. NC0429]